MSETSLAELRDVQRRRRQALLEVGRLNYDRIVAIRAAIDAGHSQTEVARELGLSRQAVANLLRKGNLD